MKIKNWVTFKYSYHLREEVSAQIDKLIEIGIIRKSSSQWTSPIWVVSKKSDNSGKKKYRIVVDYRKLNEKTPADMDTWSGRNFR